MFKLCAVAGLKAQETTGNMLYKEELMLQHSITAMASSIICHSYWPEYVSLIRMVHDSSSADKMSPELVATPNKADFTGYKIARGVEHMSLRKLPLVPVKS